MKSSELKIEGMSCSHCVMAVKKGLAAIASLTVKDVQIGKAHVQYDETKVSQEKLAAAIDEAGYKLVSVE
ncbi:MAG: heavy-metal-associated domain-containing protein [Bacteroidota bacterium]|nr:heavy-metal-associated domain-containing protein [Bacteroidota bacterium]